MKEVKKIFKEMMEMVPGFDIMEIKERNEGKFRFPIYLTENMKNTEIEVLDLTVRSTNCLRRAGINTIGDFVESVSCEEDLKRIRSCGEKSVKEIMQKVFCWQYEMLGEGMRKNYVKQIVKLN